MRRVSDAARGHAIGKSTCFNVLNRRLSKETILTDARTAQWRLGPQRLRLDATTRRCHSCRRVLRQAEKSLVDMPRLTAAAASMAVAHTLPANILSALQ
jgi:hypothetical protein